MKLLLDENLSHRLVESLSELFPDIAHINQFELQEASDINIWNFAIENNFIIVSKDSDFHQMSFLLGPPPKVIWIQRGNCSTKDIQGILTKNHSKIEQFERDAQAAFLILE